MGAGLLTRRASGERWRVSPRALERWRTAGGGPDRLRLGVRIVYRFDDVLAYEQACLRLP